MWTGAGLWVVLHGEDRQGTVGKALDRTVVCVDVAYREATLWRDGRRINLEPVVLRRDVNAPGGEITPSVPRLAASRPTTGTARKRSAKGPTEISGEPPALFIGPDEN